MRTLNVCFILTSFIWAAQSLAGTLAETPLILQQQVKPNVIMAVDDSGSMDFEILLPTRDGVAWWHTEQRSFTGMGLEAGPGQDGVSSFNIGGEGAHWKTYVYLFPNGIGAGSRVHPDSEEGGHAIPPLPQYAWARCPRYNTSSFDPGRLYLPWVSTSTNTFGNAPPEAAPSDPVIGSLTVDLTADIRSDAPNHTFRMHPGMVIPAGTSHAFDTGGWGEAVEDLTLEDSVDVGIAYFPAVFYLTLSDQLPDGYGFIGTPLTGYAPDGSTRLAGYEIRPENFENQEAYASAIQNFANWFTYHRKRHAAIRGALGSALAAMPNIRVGLFTTNDPTAITMRDLGDISERGALLDQIYAIGGSSGPSPNKQGLKHIGEQYRRTDSGAPITAPCQHNFAILFTDGYSDAWDDAGVGNADGDQGSPYADSAYNTMADIAMRYYSTNLRPDLGPGGVPIPGQCLTGSPPPAMNCNTSLHMVTCAVTVGSKGVILGLDEAATTDPYGNPPIWPTEIPDRHPSAVDDLWHATINGRGMLLSADSADQISRTLNRVLSTAVATSGSMAAVAANTTRATEGAAVYQARFSSIDWSGQLLAFRIDGTLQEQVWDAAERIPSSRSVFTADPQASSSPGRPFTWPNLSPVQQSALNIDAAGVPDGLGESRLGYLRGVRDQEQQSGGPFRNRRVLLGDIVNSDPLYVGTPDFGFHTLPGAEGASYLSFRQSTQYRSRTPMIYVGANGGMLHGFDATLDPENGGREMFAYVPHTIFPKLSRLSSPGYEHAYFVDGPPRAVDAYVDGWWRTVLVGTLGAGGKGVFALDVTDPDSFSSLDVLWEINDATPGFEDLGHVMGPAAIVRLVSEERWAVVFGNGYHSRNHKAVLHVVDISDGSLIRTIDTEATGSAAHPNGLSAPRSLDTNGDRITDYVYAGDLQGNMWKFDLRHHQPEQWGPAHSQGDSPRPLFRARDPEGDPQPITTLPTLLTHAHGGYMVIFGTGKLFEIEDIDASATRIQTLYGIRDKAGSGTDWDGLTRSDLLWQEILWEGQWTTEEGDAGMDGGSGVKVRVVSERAVDWETHQGWFLDLVSPVHGEQGERVISDPVLIRTRKGDRAVLFNTMIPSSEPCGFGGSGWLMELDAMNGGRFGYSLLDFDGDGLIDDRDFVRARVNDQWVMLPVSGLAPAGEGFASSTRIISAEESRSRIYGLTSGTVQVVTEPGLGEASGRQSWRQLR
jgi:type IV pilus assembly protein PilY1